MVLKIRATTRLLLSILIGLSFCLSACNWQSDRLIPKPGDTSLPAGKEVSPGLGMRRSLCQLQALKQNDSPIKIDSSRRVVARIFNTISIYLS